MSQAPKCHSVNHTRQKRPQTNQGTPLPTHKRSGASSNAQTAGTEGYETTGMQDDYYTHCQPCVSNSQRPSEALPTLQRTTTPKPTPATISPPIADPSLSGYIQALGFRQTVLVFCANLVAWSPLQGLQTDCRLQSPMAQCPARTNVGTHFQLLAFDSACLPTHRQRRFRKVFEIIRQTV